MEEKKVPGIIVALDGMTHSEAIALAKKLPPTHKSGVILKANDLLDDPGPQIIHEFGNLGFLVFADAKLHDIPQTVGNRARKLDSGHAHFITVHGSGEVEMMRAAVKATEHSNILAVTVLTSLGEEECQETFGSSVKATVLRFARKAVLAEVQGIVCSPQELQFISKFSELNKLIKVTPGIRPAWHTKKDDQKRVTTAADAALFGADYIVIGRPITEAKDPAEAVKLTHLEMAEALASDRFQAQGG